MVPGLFVLFVWLFFGLGFSDLYFSGYCFQVKVFLFADFMLALVYGYLSD